MMMHILSVRGRVCFFYVIMDRITHIGAFMINFNPYI